MRVADWLKTAILAKKKWPPRPFFLDVSKIACYVKGPSMPSLTFLSGRAKETISSTSLLLVSIIYWLRSKFLEHPPSPPPLNFRPSLDLEKAKFV